jgi:exodeoxyribonuclease-1
MFYWHDYETWGADPSRDRAAQFAGVRTDASLKMMGRPLMLFCRPADDMLPHPEACLITGITPQKALREGVREAEFFAAIHGELSRPGTCGVGYNSIRFDDEVTRYGLYRNFFDPYAREWQNGNSRWDIIDVVRLTHALRPEGIEWPQREDGTTSFRLEELTAANGISHEGAHDALSDVFATIDLARLIRRRQPRLFNYLLTLRDKRRVGALLNLREMKPVLHVSSMYPASRGCIAMVVPLARHPTNTNGVIVYDLMQDPTPLLTLDAETIAERLFTPRDALPEGVERIPLKTIHLNKSPAVVPMNTLTDQAAERWGVDAAVGERHLARLQAAGGLEQKIQAVHVTRRFEPITDPDRNLYGGGFFSDADRRRVEQVRHTEAGALADLKLLFDDGRLPEMLFRYRARNWPETLSADERRQWDEFRRARLSDPDASGITLSGFRGELARAMVSSETSERDRVILSELADWPAAIEME